MRLDLFLKWSRVILRRTVAKETCDAGRVRVNDAQARAGSDVRVGDSVTIDLPRRRIRFKIRAIPAHPPDKATAREMVELWEDVRKE
jgi:ribosomal 50S subunit-recycling heat shock protein